MKLTEEFKFLNSVRFKSLKLTYGENIRMDGEKCRQVESIINSVEISFCEQNDRLISLFKEWTSKQQARKDKMANKLKQKELDELQSNGSTSQQAILNRASKTLKRRELPFEGNGMHKKRADLRQIDGLLIIDENVEEIELKKPNVDIDAPTNIAEDDLRLTDDSSSDCNEYNPNNPSTGFDAALNSSMHDEMKKFREEMKIENEKYMAAFHDEMLKENKKIMKKLQKQLLSNQSADLVDDLKDLKLRVKLLLKKYQQ